MASGFGFYRTFGVRLGWACVLAALMSGSVYARNLRIYHIDVEDADATLMVAPNGKTLLVDSGARGHGSRIREMLLEAGADQIDFFVNTHYHDDHYGGFSELVSLGVPVVRSFDRGDKRFLPPAKKDHAVYRLYTESVGQRVRQMTRGMTIPLDPSMTVTCIASGGVVVGEEPPQTGNNENDRSIALLVTMGDFRYFVGGDIQRAVEDKIAARNLVLDVDVYRANNHGSKDSSAAFLRDLRPSVVIVSGAPPGYREAPLLELVRSFGTEGQPPALFQTHRPSRPADGPDGTDPAGTKEPIGPGKGTILVTVDATGDAFSISTGDYSSDSFLVKRRASRPEGLIEREPEVLAQETVQPDRQGPAEDPDALSSGEGGIDEETAVSDASGAEETFGLSDPPEAAVDPDAILWDALLDVVPRTDIESTLAAEQPGETSESAASAEPASDPLSEAVTDIATIAPGPSEDSSWPRSLAILLMGGVVAATVGYSWMRGSRPGSAPATLSEALVSDAPSPTGVSRFPVVRAPAVPVGEGKGTTPSGLCWERFSDSDVPQRLAGGERYTWVRIQSGSLTSRQGDVQVDLSEQIDFLSNVPATIENSVCISVRERPGTEADLASVGAEVIHVYNKGAALGVALSHCADAEKAFRLKSEVGLWLSETEGVLSKRFSEETARLVVRVESHNLKQMVQRVADQMLKLMEGAVRFRNTQSTPIRLHSGALIGPGAEIFEESVTAFELEHLVDVGALAHPDDS